MTPDLRALSDRERFDWLRLSRSGSVGPRTFLGLLQRYGTARAALDALPHLAKRSGRELQLATEAEVEREIAAARKAGVVFVALCEPAYPPSLRMIDSAPPVLAVKGKLDVLQRSVVAIVGSRNASASGLLMTERLAAGLGAAGHLVASGLARGIDAAAHKASLDTGTVAVLAGGHARVYPSEHIRLAERIAESGAVISEMPIAWEPRARDFPRRNRIVSGRSLGVVVVEAARRSGSLITARFANEQGREVFAVPGSPLDPRAEGANDLIRQGATLCAGVDDVLDVLQPILAAPRGSKGFGMREASRPAGDDGLWSEAEFDPGMDAEIDEPAGTVRARIETLIGAAPTSVDDLVRLSAASVNVVQTVLIDLELEGKILRHGANGVARVTG